MNIHSGTILISSPSLEDTNFDKVVVLITEYNEKGAMGFVINQPYYRTLHELEEFKEGISFPIFDGGPMDREHLYFIHQRADIIHGGIIIDASIYFGGNFTTAVTNINKKMIAQKDIKIFIGYCGWDYQQLEEEIKEGSWLIINNNNQIIFSADVSMLWGNLYEEKNSPTKMPD